MGPTPEHGSRGKSHYAIGSSQCHVTPTGQRSDVCPLRPPRVGPLVWYTTQQAEQRRHGGLQDPASECFPLWPLTRTLLDAVVMSQSCQYRTNSGTLDHLFC